MWVTLKRAIEFHDQIIPKGQKVRLNKDRPGYASWRNITFFIVADDYHQLYC